MSWYAERQEQKREDKRADVELELRQKEFDAEQARKDRKDASAEKRKDREAAEKRKAERRERRSKAIKAISATLTENKVALSIYGIALVSFVMSAPAMADYGTRLYEGSAWPWTGWLLPIVTELSMWACAFAVHHTRRTTPGASVFWLQVGVALATALAAGLNAMKGFTVGWDASVVMGVVSIAGVLLHQMTVAGQPRTREQRDADKIARQIARKEFDARQAAIRDARVEITAEGTAKVVFEPGVYRVGRERKAGLSREGDVLDWPGARDVMDDEIAALIDAEIAREVADEADETAPGGGVATLERPTPETGSETGSASNKPAKTPPRRGGRAERRMDDLRGEFEALRRVKPEAVSWSKTRLARELKCDKKLAIQLWNELHASRREGGR